MMENKINIQKVRFEFNMENEKSAFDLYADWHSFYYTMFERVTERVLANFDRKDDHLFIEKLDIDLGEIHKEEFYEKFSCLLEEKLIELLEKLNIKDGIKEVKKTKEKVLFFEAFTYYLIHGFYPWCGIVVGDNFKTIFRKVLSEYSDEFRKFLSTYGHYSSLRRRLVLQLDNEDIQKTIVLYNRAESPFIISYFNLLINDKVKRKVGSGKIRDHRNACWEVILAYLMVRKGGYFNRKEFIGQTISELAAHYNIHFNLLLSFLTKAVDGFLLDSNEHSELKRILLELSDELVSSGKTGEREYQERINELYDWINRGNIPDGVDYKTLIILFEDKRFRDYLLSKLSYPQLVELTCLIEKDPTSLALLLQIHMGELLEANIEHEVAGQATVIVSEQKESKISAIYLAEIKRLLKQPNSRRILIAKLDEQSIYALVKALVPDESDFIISYSQSLDEQKEKNIFEGKAGGEFRQLKWEFIFAVLIEDADMSFNRKAFVLSVITLLASHYNLKIVELLSYIFKAIIEKKINIDPELSEILKGLYFETKAEKPKLQEINFFDKALREAFYASILKEFIQTGTLSDNTIAIKIFDILEYLERYRPDLLLTVVEELKGGFILDDSTYITKHKEFYRKLIRFIIESFQIRIPGGQQVKSLFANLDDDRFLAVSIKTFKTLLLAILKNDVSLFQYASQILTEKLKLDTDKGLVLLEFISDEVLLKSISVSDHGALKKLIDSDPNKFVNRVFSSVDLIVWIAECYIINPSIAQSLEDTLAGYMPGNLFARLCRMFPNRTDELKLLLNLSLAVRPSGKGYGSLIFELLICLVKKKEPFIENVLQKYFANAFDNNEAAKALAFLMDTIQRSSLAPSLKVSIESIIEKISSSESGSNFPEQNDSSDQKEFLIWLLDNFNKDNVMLYDESLKYPFSANPVVFSAFEKILIDQPELVRQLIHEGKLSRQKISSWLKKSPLSTQIRWLLVVTPPYQKILIDEAFILIEWLQAALVHIPGAFIPWAQINLLLLDYSSGKLQHIGRNELFVRLIAMIVDKIDVDKEKIIAEVQARASNHGRLWGKRMEAVLQKVISGEMDNKEMEEPQIPPTNKTYIHEEPENLEEMYISNAGLVLCTPFMPQLFNILGLLSEGVFIDRKSNERAVLLLQYMLYNQTFFPEHEMVLNKVLCGLTTGTPIDYEIDITSQEKTTMEQMLNGMIQHWGKLGNTSVTGLVESFLCRQGKLVQKEDVWQLTVEQKGFDVLLDSLPWSYTPIKHRWMKKPLTVKWR